MVTDVNEPPAVTGDAAVTFQGEAGDITTVLPIYSEDNPEDNVLSTWSVTGTDAGKFEISTDGGLTFKAKPDFEKPGDANTDNVYEVTVVAADEDGNRGTMDVKVTVANEDEDGTVTLSKIQPRVGVAVKASLTDPDGSISGLTWQWSKGGVGIDDAISDTYTPVEADIGDTLTATASYTDGHEPGKTMAGMAANMVAEDTRNRAPAFVDQDTETDGLQNEATRRKVEENTAADATDDSDTDEAGDNVGGPVTAEDPDPNEDPLTYTLGGADADKFRVRSNGRIEVGSGTKLDYETEDTYMVTVMAEDSFGESASIMVTIMVTDVDEVPEIMRGTVLNDAPEFASATTSRTVAENTAASGDIGTPVAATDADNDTLTYSLSGPMPRSST